MYPQEPNDWLIVYCYTFHSMVFHIYWDLAIVVEGLQHLCLLRRLGPLNKEESLLCDTCSVTGPQAGFVILSEGSPHSVISNEKIEVPRNYSIPYPHGTFNKMFAWNDYLNNIHAYIYVYYPAIAPWCNAVMHVYISYAGTIFSYSPYHQFLKYEVTKKPTKFQKIWFIL